MDCIGEICFFALNPNGTKIFGFSEYISALALIVLAWTTVDYRYRLHVQTSAINVRLLAFYGVGCIGLLTLATDLWRASGWFVPEIGIVTPELWQAILGIAFLAVFLTWTSIAFLKPPTFNSRNATRFIDIIYREVKQGDQSQIAQMADAMARSASSIVQMSYQFSKHRADPSQAEKYEPGHQALELIADPRICNVIVTRAPALLDSLFQELKTSPHNSRGTYTLARNVLNAAIMEEASFLHHEVANWQHGPAAASQPITSRIFGNIRLLDEIPGVFSLGSTLHWKATHWQAYLRAAGQAIHGYVGEVEQGMLRPSTTIVNIFNELRDAPAALGTSRKSGLESDAEFALVLSELVRFVKEVATRLGSSKVAPVRWNALDHHYNPVQLIAELSYKILLASSYVRSSANTAWHFQKHIAWSGIFESLRSEPHHTYILENRELVARMIWMSVRELDYSPNYVGAQMLGLCVNVGLVRDKRWVPASDKVSAQEALARLVTYWTRRRFASLYRYHPSLAVVGFAEGINYNKRKRLISKEQEINAFRAKPEFILFQVDAAPPGKSEDHVLGTRPPPFSPPKNRRKMQDRPWF